MQQSTVSNAASPAYSWLVVAILMVAYVVSFIDRQIMALLIEPIRADLHINDTQFGLLHGLAFSLFYATLGIPIATLTDRRSRPMIIAAGVLFWSLATAACGLAKSFGHLLIARFSVGAGEAVLAPATYSLLADLFPKEKLGRAVAVFSTGSFVGAGLAFLLGGAVIAAVSDGIQLDLPWLGELRAWQLAFIIVGLPGVILALIIALTIREQPRKEIFDGGGDDQSVWRFLARHWQVFTAHYFGYSMAAMILFSLLSWTPAFLIRNFSLSAQQSGYVLGSMVMVSCTLGVLTSGWLMDWLQRRGYNDASMRTGIIGAAGVMLPAALLLIVPALLPAERSFPIVLALLAVAFFFGAFPMPPSTAAMQLLAPNRLRARVSSVFLFFNSLLGLALGSIIIGSLTDYVFGDPKAVGKSLAVVLLGAGTLSIISLGIGCRLFRDTLIARAANSRPQADQSGASNRRFPSAESVTPG
jgi:MFS family permease